MILAAQNRLAWNDRKGKYQVTYAHRLVNTHKPEYLCQLTIYSKLSHRHPMILLLNHCIFAMPFTSAIEHANAQTQTETMRKREPPLPTRLPLPTNLPKEISHTRALQKHSPLLHPPRYLNIQLRQNKPLPQTCNPSQLPALAAVRCITKQPPPQLRLQICYHNLVAFYCQRHLKATPSVAECN